VCLGDMPSSRLDLVLVRVGVEVSEGDALLSEELGLDEMGEDLRDNEGIGRKCK
jgi:hypothetical protein